MQNSDVNMSVELFRMRMKALQYMLSKCTFTS